MKTVLLLIFGTILLLSGCQTAPEDSSTNSSAAISSIPWNKPAGWEGSGALGGFAPQSH